MNEKVNMCLLKSFLQDTSYIHILLLSLFGINKLELFIGQDRSHPNNILGQINRFRFDLKNRSKILSKSDPNYIF